MFLFFMPFDPITNLTYVLMDNFNPCFRCWLTQRLPSKLKNMSALISRNNINLKNHINQTQIQNSFFSKSLKIRIKIIVIS